MVSYEKLGPTDAPLLASVGGVSLLQSHGHSAPANIMQAYVDKNFSEETCRIELSDEKNHFSAIFYKGQPAGYFKIVLATPHPMVPLEPVTKLERFYLLQEFYGLGLAQGLLQQVIALSAQHGDKGAWLDVWKKNERAIRFYKKEGFETVGESQFVLTETHTNPTWVLLRRYSSVQ